MHRLALGIVSAVAFWGVWAVWAPAQARAERTVAVLSVRAPGAKRIRAWLESEIRDTFRLVEQEAVRDAATELGLRRHWTRPRNLRRIARRARVDALVAVSVYRARRRWWLAVRVYDGGTGKVVKSGVVIYRYFALTRWVKRAIWKTVRLGVRAVEGVPHPRPRLLSPAEEAPTRPKPPPPKSTPVRAGPRPLWMPALRVGIGLSVMGRRLSVYNLEGRPGATILYETDAPVVPLALFAEVFPGAFASRHRVLANIGLGFRFRRAFGVVSTQESTGERVTTTVQQFRGYLLYRWHVRPTDTAPEFAFALGVDALGFGFDRNLGTVASVMYISLRPEVRARVPLGLERVALGLSLAGLGVLSVGQMANAYHYGAAQAGGVHAGLEVDVRLYWRLHLLVGAWVDWYFLTFPQVGQIHLDYEYVADSARDGYYGGYLSVSVDY